MNGTHSSCKFWVSLTYAVHRDQPSTNTTKPCHFYHDLLLGGRGELGRPADYFVSEGAMPPKARPSFGLSLSMGSQRVVQEKPEGRGQPMHGFPVVSRDEAQDRRKNAKFGFIGLFLGLIGML